MKFIAILLIALVAVAPAAFAESVEQQRAAIHRMEVNALTKLYEQNPRAQQEVQNAVGYAVFSNGSLAIVWISGGYGHGVAHDNRSGENTYMQMASAGVGLGLGAKDYNMVFIFNDAQAFENFKAKGLDLGGQVDAAAKVEEKGGAASGAANILPGVRIYQLTDTGLMAQAMVQGTKYWRDSDLNN